MTAVHLVYQHWFITLLLIWWGAVPLVGAVGRAAGFRRTRGVARKPEADACK